MIRSRYTSRVVCRPARVASIYFSLACKSNKLNDIKRHWYMFLSTFTRRTHRSCREIPAREPLGSKAAPLSHNLIRRRRASTIFTNRYIYISKNLINNAITLPFIPLLHRDPQKCVRFQIPFRYTMYSSDKIIHIYTSLNLQRYYDIYK